LKITKVSQMMDQEWDNSPARLPGLNLGTTYYVRAYATNSAGTAYGNQISLTIDVMMPAVTTSAIASITSNSVTGGGNVTSSGGATATARGIAYGTSQYPTISGSTVAAGERYRLIHSQSYRA
jgi:hypothetical protein